MSAESFSQLLRSLLSHKPFQPFRVEMTEGRSFVVDEPEAVAHCNGAAGFIGPDKEVYFFSHEDTLQMGDAMQESAI